MLSEKGVREGVGWVGNGGCTADPFGGAALVKQGEVEDGHVVGVGEAEDAEAVAARA
jgi:hypothetical protein